MGYIANLNPILARRSLAALWACGMLGLAAAGESAPGSAVPAPGGRGHGKHGERSIGDWLMRMHEASRLRSYVGTFVVTSSNGGMSSARIWHACNGSQQVERVESLTGAPALDLPAQRRSRHFHAREPGGAHRTARVPRAVSQPGEGRRQLDPRVLFGAASRRRPGRRFRDGRRPAGAQGQPAVRLPHLERKENGPGRQAADRGRRGQCPGAGRFLRTRARCARCASKSSAR